MELDPNQATVTDKDAPAALRHIRRRVSFTFSVRVPIDYDTD